MAKINWNEFLSSNDMSWDTLPTNWCEGAFVGNGLLGTIFWKNEACNLDFEMGRTDFYDHRDEEHILYSNIRLPNGHFTLSMNNKPITGNLRLNLYDAQVIGTIENDNGTANIRVLTHATKDIIIIELEQTKNVCDFEWTFSSDACLSTRDFKVPENYLPYPKQITQVIDNINVSIQSIPDDEIYHTKGKGVGQFATAWKVVKLENKTYLYASMGFSYPGEYATQMAVDNVRDAISEDFTTLFASHTSWWHDYYKKSFMSIDDKKLQIYYWIQMYKMASATRGDKPMLDLLGPWFRPTVWPAIWWNLNIQLTYWPIYMSNHCDFGNSLINLLHENKHTLAKNCELDRDDVFAIGRASSHNLDAPVGFETGNLAYALNNVWQHYLYTMDDEMLKNKLLPLLIGSLKYILTLTYTADDNKIHIKPSASPEYTDDVEDCSYTLSLIRWLAKSIIWSQNRFNIQDEFTDVCKNLLENLVDYQQDETGIMIGANMPLEFSHRHWSHLFMIYPLYEYTYEQADKIDIINKSLNHWLDKDERFVGYSRVAATSIYAMMGNGDKAIESLYKYFADTTRHCPNTMYVEGPKNPVIETPFFIARAVQDMLLGSYNGIIRIFPAVPTTWENAHFENFLAEGGFDVSAKMSDGKFEFAKIKSLAGERCLVKKTCFSDIEISGEREFKITHISDDVFEIDLKKGEEIVLA